MPKTYTTDAIVLARKNYSEADRILIVYSKKYGKLALIAKGVRKPKSRKRGSLEVFSKIRFAASRTKGLDIVTETQLLESYQGIRKNLKRASVAYFMLEAIGRLTRDEEQNRELFNLMSDYLDKLVTEKKVRKLREVFVEEVLTLLGFWPVNKNLKNPDQFLEQVVEREMTSVRVGKKILT